MSDFWRVVDARVNVREAMAIAARQRKARLDERRRAQRHRNCRSVIFDSLKNKRALPPPRSPNNSATSNAPLQHGLATPIKQFPADFERNYNALMRSSGVFFVVHRRIEFLVARLAVKQLSAHWFAAWHFVFAFVAQWPHETLPRCHAHVGALLRAQKQSTIAFERALAGQGCDDDDDADAPPLQTTNGCAPSMARASQSLPLPCATADANALFMQACSEHGVPFALRRDVFTLVRAEHHHDTAARRALLFEAYWMHIYAVAQRAGAVFLKRECLDGHLLQLARSDSAFRRTCQQRFGNAAPLDGTYTVAPADQLSNRDARLVAAQLDRALESF